MAAKTSIYSKIFISRFGRSFRKSFKKTNCQLCQLDARSRGIPYRCLYSKLAQRKGVRFSPFHSYNKSFNESNEGTSNYRTSGSSLEDTTVVASPSQMCWKSPVLLPQNKDLLLEPINPAKRSPTVPEVNTGRLFHIRQCYENRSLSQKTIELMLSAHPKSTHKTYQSAWKSGIAGVV